MDNLCHIREFVPFWTGETLRIVQPARGAVGPRPHRYRDASPPSRTPRHTRLEDVVADIREAVRRSAETLQIAERRGPRGRGR